MNHWEIIFFFEKTLQFASRICLQAFNTMKKAFDDKHFAFKVTKSVGTALLPSFIDIVVQWKGEDSYSYST